MKILSSPRHQSSLSFRSIHDDPLTLNQPPATHAQRLYECPTHHIMKQECDSSQNLRGDTITSFLCRIMDKLHFRSSSGSVDNAWDRVRQAMRATAIVLFRRFFLRVCICEYNPRLVALGCIVIASKLENVPIKIKLLLDVVSKHDNMFKVINEDIKDIELRLIDVLRGYLLVLHPYRPVFEMLSNIGLEEVILPSASLVINDTFLYTDLSVLVPAQVIAAAAILVAGTVHGYNVHACFDAESLLQLNPVVAVIREMYVTDVSDGNK